MQVKCHEVERDCSSHNTLSIVQCFTEHVNGLKKFYAHSIQTHYPIYTHPRTVMVKVSDCNQTQLAGVV